MRPDQLDLLTTVSAPEIHPSGTWALVSTSRPSFEVDSYVGQLWRVPLDGSGEPRRLTRGRADAGAKFSPDGQLVAFLRAVDGKPQLHLVESSGGEPVAITDQKLGVREFCFSPDGATIAFTARVPEEGRYGTDDDIPSALEDPRHFTGNKLQMNGLGWLNGRPLQVFTVATPSLDDEPRLKPIGRAKPKPTGDDDAPVSPLVPQPTRLTEDDVDWTNPAFTPDGSALVLSASAHDDRENDLVSDLHHLALDSRQVTRLTNTAKISRRNHLIGASNPVFSRDGKHLFFIGQPLGEDGLDFVGHHAQVFVMPAPTGRKPKGGKVTEVTSADWTVASAPRPFGDDGVIVTDEHRGSGRILTASARGAVEVLYDGAFMAEGVAAVGDAAGEIVVATVAGPRTMGEVALVRGGKARDGEVQLLTDFSAALQRETTIVDPVEFETTGPDGYPVHGWVLKPSGSSGRKKGKQKTPVLLNIHGGPYAAYHETYFDEFQTYLEAGYAVVACNPRGAMGYGAEHGQAIKGGFGDLDMTDILAFLDAALAENPDLDADRVGIMGGSYGGYMTAWIIGHDHRWAGAIVERGFLDGATFVGSSDIGWFFAGEYQGHTAEEMNRQSPMWLTDRVTTPTLVLHSELDLRCPIAQGLNYYGRLKQAGVDAEILIFPGENHELSRSGSPWHRRQRFEKILEFWAKHLPSSVNTLQG